MLSSFDASQIRAIRYHPSNSLGATSSHSSIARHCGQLRDLAMAGDGPSDWRLANQERAFAP